MKPAVLSPAARSRSRCSMGRRISAWVPVRKTRPEVRVYLSSSVADSAQGRARLLIGCLHFVRLVGVVSDWATGGGGGSAPEDLSIGPGLRHRAIAFELALGHIHQ